MKKGTHTIAYLQLDKTDDVMNNTSKHVTTLCLIFTFVAPPPQVTRSCVGVT